MIRLTTAISCWMVPSLSSSNFSAISITFANERRSPFSALLRHTSAAATILGTLRRPCASLIRTVLKKASLSSAALFFLPLGRPFGFPDWPFLKRVSMSFRISSAIFVFRGAHVVPEGVGGGGRQPRADQVPPESHLMNPNDPINRENARLDRMI